LDGDEILHELFIHTAAKLAQGLGQDKVGLRGIDLIVSKATGVHNGKVGPQAIADLFIRGAQFMLEQLQGQQDADGHGPSATRGFCREPLVETLLDGADEPPREGVRPLPNGMHNGDKIGDLQGGSSTAQPMLEITRKAHDRLSCCKGE
jgi:hypothetical protein